MFFNMQKNSLQGSSETELKKMKTSANLNARQAASTKGKLITTIPVGSEVSISTENADPLGEWARIIYQNAPAFVASRYLVELGTSVTPSSTPWSSKDAAPPPEPTDTTPTTGAPGSFVETITNMSTTNKVLIASGVASIAMIVVYFVSKKKKEA